MISVLVPSRGRCGPLGESIASLLGNAADPGSVEIWVAIDPDEWMAYRDLPRDSTYVHFYIAPERWGYSQLHRYFNELARVARGEWLMLWNDDARMLTRGWDDEIHHWPHQVLWMKANYAPGINMFPIWPTAWYDVCGHVSLVPQADRWIDDVGRSLGAWRIIPVEVEHQRADITGQHDDQTYAEGRARLGSLGSDPSYDDPRHAAARQKDAGLILQYEMSLLDR